MEAQENKTYYAVIDVETTGVDFIDSVDAGTELLSIALILLDDSLEEVARYYDVIGMSEKAIENTPMDDYVRYMHTETGLFEEMHKSDKRYVEIDEELFSLIVDNVGFDHKIVAVGNNIKFDMHFVRKFLPLTHTRFHYSYLDVSAIRKAISLVHLGFSDKVYSLKKSNHNALVDAEECIKELESYLIGLAKLTEGDFLGYLEDKNSDVE